MSFWRIILWLAGLMAFGVGIWLGNDFLVVQATVCMTGAIIVGENERVAKAQVEAIVGGIGQMLSIMMGMTTEQNTTIVQIIGRQKKDIN